MRPGILKRMGRTAKEGGGQQRDEGDNNLVLHGHRAAQGLTLVQGQRGAEGAISY